MGVYALHWATVQHGPRAMCGSRCEMRALRVGTGLPARVLLLGSLLYIFMENHANKEACSGEELGQYAPLPPSSPHSASALNLTGRTRRSISCALGELQPQPR